MNLSYNKIKKIENLKNCLKLTRINLSHNLIENIEFSYLSNLQYLNLSYNKIIDCNQCGDLKAVKSLKNLNLRGNPLLNEIKENKLSILIGEMLPNIKIFNNKPLQEINSQIIEKENNNFNNDEFLYENSIFTQDIKLDRALSI